MRARCLSLLLALVAWFTVGAVARPVASLDRTSGVAATTIAASPAAVERDSKPADPRARSQAQPHGVTGDVFELASAAFLSFTLVPRNHDDTIVVRPRASAQPRGPPLA